MSRQQFEVIGDGIYDRLQAFVEWGDHLESILPSNFDENTNDGLAICVCLNSMSKLLEEADEIFLRTPGRLISDRKDGLCGKLMLIIQDMDDILGRVIFQLFGSRDPYRKFSAVRFMAASSVISSSPPSFVYEVTSMQDNFDKIVDLAKSQDESTIRDYATALLSTGGSSRFVTDLLVRTDLPQLLIQRLRIAHDHLIQQQSHCETTLTVTNPFLSILPTPAPRPGDENTLNTDWARPLHVNDGSTYWCYVATYCLALLKAVVEYVEMLGPVVSEGCTSLVMQICSLNLKPENLPLPPALRMRAVGFLANAMAHKRIAWDFVDQGGVDLLAQLWGSGDTGVSLMQPQLAACLHSIAAHDGPMEKIMRSSEAVRTIVSLGLDLLKVSDEHTQHYAMFFFGEALSFIPVLNMFESFEGLYHLLNVFRVSLSDEHEDSSSKHRINLQKECGRTLILYIRTLTYSDAEIARTHLTPDPIKALRPDENQFSVARAFLYDQLDITGGLPASMETVGVDGHRVWTASAGILHHRGIELMLRSLTCQQRTSEMLCYVLGALEVLCYEAAVIAEIISTIVPPPQRDTDSERLRLGQAYAAGAQAQSQTDDRGTKGMAVVLSCANGTVTRDALVMIEGLRLLAALVTPPAFQLDRCPTVASSDQPSPLERAQMNARRALRACSGIRPILQLLSYRRSVQHVDAVRLGAVQVLLGLNEDPDVSQLLDKLGLAQTISAMLQTMPQSASSWQGPSTLQMLRNRALVLLTRLHPHSHVLVGASGLTGVNGVGDGGASNGLCARHNDAFSSKLTLEREAIVARTQINFPPEELLLLIRDHLRTSGLSATAAALEAEASLLPEDSSYAPPVGSHVTPALKRSNTNASSISGSGSGSTSPQRVRYNAAAGEFAEQSTPSDKITMNGRSTSTIKSTEGPASSITNKRRSVAAGLSRDGRDKDKDKDKETMRESPSLTIRPLHQTLSSSKKPRVSMDTPSFTASNLPTPSSSSSSSQHVKTTGTGMGMGESHIRVGGPYRRLTGFLRRAISKPSYFSSTPASEGTSMISSSKPASHYMTSGKPSVTLMGIVQGYLRHQHLQCSHPVTVGPPFSLLQPHHCPSPSPEPLSILSALDDRSQPWRYRPKLQYQNSDNAFKEFTYSRWRAWRTFREAEHMVTCSAFAMDPSKLWVGATEQGSDSGLITLYDLMTFSELGSWHMPSLSSVSCSPVASVPLMMTTTTVAEAALMNPVLSYEVNIWRVAAGAEANYFNTPVMSFPSPDLPEIRRPVFSPSAEKIAGLHFNPQDHLVCSVFDLQTNTSICTLDASSDTPSYRRPTVCFAPSGHGGDGDKIIFSDGMLWDIRTGAMTHRFDRLTSYGAATFHPNGYSLLIDSAVWDIRKETLLQTVPRLESCQSQFLSYGNVLVAHSAFAVEDFHAGRRRNEDQSKFFILDSTDYTEIHTHTLDREGAVILSLQADDTGLGLVSLVEASLDSGGLQDSCCRVLEPGKRRDENGDSDSEDAASDPEDDEWGSGDEDEIDEDDDDSEEDNGFDTGSMDTDDDDEEDFSDDSSRDARMLIAINDREQAEEDAANEEEEEEEDSDFLEDSEFDDEEDDEDDNFEEIEMSAGEDGSSEDDGDEEEAEESEGSLDPGPQTNVSHENGNDVGVDSTDNVERRVRGSGRVRGRPQNNSGRGVRSEADAEEEWETVSSSDDEEDDEDDDVDVGIVSGGDSADTDKNNDNDKDKDITYCGVQFEPSKPFQTGTWVVLDVIDSLATRLGVLRTSGHTANETLRRIPFLD
eukprot:gene9459-19643_t